jgi:hypothetical protein
MRRLILFSLLTLLTIVSYSQVNLSTAFTYSLGKAYQVVDANEKYYFRTGNYLMKASLEKEILTLQNFDIQNLA